VQKIIISLKTVRSEFVTVTLAVILIPVIVTLSSTAAIGQASEDIRVQAAGNNVIAAQNVYFAAEGMYSDSYETLRTRGRLVADPSICYGPIETYLVTETGTEGFKFSVGPAADRGSSSIAYSYDSTKSGNRATRTSNTFECSRFAGAGSR
jgi:hypothetical protein